LFLPLISICARISRALHCSPFDTTTLLNTRSIQNTDVLCQTQDLWSNSREVSVCFSCYAYATILLSEHEIKENRKRGENNALVEGAFFPPPLFWPPFIFACQRVFRLRVAFCYQNLSPQPYVVLLAALIRRNSRQAFKLFSLKNCDLLPHPPFPFHKLPAAAVSSAF